MEEKDKVEYLSVYDDGDESWSMGALHVIDGSYGLVFL